MFSRMEIIHHVSANILTLIFLSFFSLSKAKILNEWISEGEKYYLARGEIEKTSFVPKCDVLGIVNRC
jgi:hypothetical protein